MSQDLAARASAAPEEAQDERSIVARLRAGLPYAIGLALLAVALWVLHDLVREFRWQDVDAELEALGWTTLLLAGTWTALSYLALVGYELVALRFVGRDVPAARAALTALVAQALAHSTGFAAIVGTAVRLRLYAAQGLRLVDVAAVQAVFSGTFALGVALLGGMALIVEPDLLAATTRLPAWVLQALGAILVGLVAAWFVASAVLRRPLRAFGRTLYAPPPGLVAAQAGLAVLDLMAAAAALWVLLPADLGIGYPALLGAFVAAVILGVVSHVPGGLGVLEGAVVLLLRPAPEHAPGVIGALLAFRAIYYLLPFLLASAVLAAAELRRGTRRLAAPLGRATAWAEPVLPTLLAGLAVIAGTTLVFSGATAAIPERIAVLPLPLVEIAHAANGLVGTGLLLVAHGLFRRLDGAWVAATLLLAGGIATSLLKGVDWEEALLLATILAIVLPCRRSFYRRTPLLAQALTPAWLLAVAAVIGASIWLLFFAYRHVEYGHELWWSFALDGDAPRSLRAAVAAVGLLGVAAVWSLVRRAPVRPHRADSLELERVRRIVTEHGSGSAWLALTGDKAFLFDASGEAFLMYGIAGCSWIAMGEPVGPIARWPGLLWDFYDRVDRAGGRPVFYEIGPERLPMFLDLGLQPVKIGESARVDLAVFSTAGKAKSDLRNAQNRARKAGMGFAVLPPGDTVPVLDELRRVSDAWLAQHKAREKRFSLGFFEPAYVAACSNAVIRDAEGRILAFANLWLPADQGTASLDLMRFLPDAPAGTMDFLITETLLWAKAAGYRWFDLGMAPLSGLPDHRLAPLWSRLGRLAVRHGAQFYNFEGLRKFKEKFDPTWTPAYVLCPVWSLPRALADTAALIAGGWRGVIAK